jgi:hypothetical protein
MVIGVSSGGGLRSTKSAPIEGMIAGIEHGSLAAARLRDAEAALTTRETLKRTKEGDVSHSIVRGRSGFRSLLADSEVESIGVRLLCLSPNRKKFSTGSTGRTGSHVQEGQRHLNDTDCGTDASQGRGEN